MADALAAVHRRGLVHRDVKPSNIVVRELGDATPDAFDRHADASHETCPAGDAVLIDFGLVKSLGPADATWTEAGAASRAFAPPEQLIGQAVGPAADVFSLGVTLFDLFTGGRAEDRPQASLGLPHLDEVIDGFDADLTAVVAKAVEPSERWRYADADELLADLRAWQLGLEVAARRPPLGERVLRRLRREPGRLVARAGWSVAAVLVAAVLMAAHARREDMTEVVRCSDAGDALAVADRLATLGAWSRVPLGVDGFSSAQHEYERSADVHGAVVDALRRGDDRAALARAVDTLDRDGYARHPLLQRYLAMRLERSARDEPGGDDARAVVAAVAQLLTVRPVESPEDVAGTTALRAVLRGRWRDPDLPRDTRLEFVSCLSGCGTPRDLVPLLDWTLTHDPGAEPYRLGMMCIVRILGRSRACEVLDELPPRSAWAEFESRCAQRFGEPDWGMEGQVYARWGAQFGALSAAVARTLAHRAAGRPADPRRLLEPSWVDALESRREGAAHVRDVGDAPLLLAAAGDPSVAEWLASAAPRTAAWHRAPYTRERPGPWAPWSTQWGVMCGMLDIESVTAEARGRIEAAVETPPGGAGPTSLREALDGHDATTDDLRMFDEGVETGRAAVRRGGFGPSPGPRHADDRDAASDPAGPVELELERRPDLSAPGVPPFSTVLDDIPPSSRGPALASWSFRRRPVHASAGARGASAVGARHDPDDRDGYVLKLVEFGEASLLLPFHLDSEPESLRLVVRQQGAARWHLPYGGKVVLEVTFDGQPVQTLTVLDPSIGDLAIAIPRTLVTAGDHVLGLRLHETSTTAWWLHLLWLDAP